MFKDFVFHRLLCVIHFVCDKYKQGKDKKVLEFFSTGMQFFNNVAATIKLFFFQM